MDLSTLIMLYTLHGFQEKTFLVAILSYMRLHTSYASKRQRPESQHNLISVDQGSNNTLPLTNTLLFANNFTCNSTRNCTSRQSKQHLRYNNLDNSMCPWGWRYLLWVRQQTTSAEVHTSHLIWTLDLEKLSYNLTANRSSFTALPLQPSAMTNLCESTVPLVLV